MDFYGAVAQANSYTPDGDNMIRPSLEGVSTTYINRVGSFIMAESNYQDYLQKKIDQEHRLLKSINTIMVEAGGTNIMLEAKITDTLKSKWKSFMAFIKNLFAKFMESMTNLLKNEQGYLEKYKDIILKKKGKSDMKYSYVGNFEKGAQRIANTQLEAFNYDAHAAELKKEGYLPILKVLIKDPEFKYSDDETLSTYCKTYFMGGDDDKEGTFDGLNFTTMYNFCMDFKNIEARTNKDITNLDNSINGIIKLAYDAEKTTSTNESAILLEGDPAGTSETNTSGGNNTSGDGDKKPGGLTTTKISKAADSYSDKDKEDMADGDKKQATADETLEKSGGKAEDVDKLLSKWKTVCQAIITAKWTASQEIAKSYMTLIRDHVRSYVGNEKDASSAPKRSGAEYPDKSGNNDNAAKKDGNTSEGNTP